MITPRRSEERGRFDHGWLDTRHTFSFGEYRDPAHMGFGPLRVLNEDRVRPGEGFPTHAHHDMEILTWVLEGELEHRDSLGNGSVIRPLELQGMTAGSGITHSEFNASQTEEVHFLQIWIVPGSRGLPPSYDSARFGEAELRAGLRLLASPDGREGSIRIHQDAELRVARIEKGGEATHPFAAGRSGWLQIARGRVRCGDLQLEAGDGAAVREETELRIEAVEDSEILLFDLP